MYDISIYGLGKKKINYDLSDLSNNQPTWSDLIPLKDTIPGLDDFRLLTREVQDISGSRWLPAFQWDSLLSTGAYGKIYKGLRAVYSPTENHQYKLSQKQEVIVLKEVEVEKNLKKDAYLTAIKAILYEATIHALVVQFFKRINWSFAVPKLYEIFSRGSSSNKDIHDIKEVVFCMEYIRGKTLFTYLNDQFNKSPSLINDGLYLRILAELALLLNQVQANLRMNHRDMKVNNILIRNKKSDWLPIFSRFYPTLERFDLFEFNLVLIDYGFACIACGDGHDAPEMSLLEAGSWFGPTDACFKSGRDLAQFIYCMQVYYPCRQYFTSSLCEVIERWLTIHCSDGMAHLQNGIAPNGKPYTTPHKMIFDTGIYEFLRRTEVNPTHCSPQNILDDIDSYIANH